MVPVLVDSGLEIGMGSGSTSLGSGVAPEIEVDVDVSSEGMRKVAQGSK